MLLPLFSLLPSPATFFGRLISIIVYTALDILSADCLYEIATSGVAVASSVYTSPRRGESWKPVSVAAVYLLNPFTLLTCLARPTTVFTTFFVLLSIRHATQGKPTSTAFALALASYTSLHPVLLLPPIGLLCYDQICKASPPPATKDGRSATSPTPLAFTLTLLAPFALTTVLLLSLSRLLLPSFTFLHSLYITPLSLPDLTPNPGLWWYFFTEMFDAFRSFFLGVFWLHMLAYSVPFTVRLRAQPLAAVIAMQGVLAIFQPYANVGEVGAWLASSCLMGHVFSSESIPTNSFHHSTQHFPEPSTNSKITSLLNPPLPLPRPRRPFVRHAPGPGLPLPVAVRRQRQRQLLLRHHAGVEPRAADPRDRSGVRGAAGRVGGREARGEGQGGEADLIRTEGQADVDLGAAVCEAWMETGVAFFPFAI